MKKEFLITLVAVVLALAAFIVALTRTPDVTPTAAIDTQPLMEAIASLQEKVTALSNAYADVSSQLATGSPTASVTPVVSTRQEPVNIDAMSGTLTLMDDSLARLETIVDSTGLEGVATNRMYDPTLLQEMVLEHAERKMIEDTRERLRTVHEEHVAADKEEYGAEVAELYEKARFRRRGNDEEREKAFQELVDDYPDAYATGMVIAERAIGNGFRGNTEEVEKYYSQLKGNEKYVSAVTEWGMEAVPAIQSYLARQYIDNGRIDDARDIIDEMKENSANSLVFRIGGRRRGERFETADKVISDLESRLNSR